MAVKFAPRMRRPALVLADVMMPRLDGSGLLRAIRDDSVLAGTPVVLLSARAGEESRVEGPKADADDYLIKPFAAQELLARLRSFRARDRRGDSIPDPGFNRAWKMRRFPATSGIQTGTRFALGSQWPEHRSKRSRNSPATRRSQCLLATASLAET